MAVNEHGAQCYVRIQTPEGERWTYERCLARLIAEPFYGLISLANGKEFRVGAFYATELTLFVGIECIGAYTFSESSDWRYVSEKLGIGESDARPMCDWIRSQYGPVTDADHTPEERYI